MFSSHSCDDREWCTGDKLTTLLQSAVMLPFLFGHYDIPKSTLFIICAGWLTYMMMIFQKLWIKFQMRLFCHSYSDRLPYQHLCIYLLVQISPCFQGSDSSSLLYSYLYHIGGRKQIMVCAHRVLGSSLLFIFRNFLQCKCDNHLQYNTIEMLYSSILILILLISSLLKVLLANQSV